MKCSACPRAHRWPRSSAPTGCSSSGTTPTPAGDRWNGSSRSRRPTSRSSAVTRRAVDRVRPGHPPGEPRNLPSGRHRPAGGAHDRRRARPGPGRTRIPAGRATLRAQGVPPSRAGGVAAHARRRSARPRTTSPTRPWSLTGTVPPGTVRHRARTGPSTRRSTRTPASTAPSTSPALARPAPLPAAIRRFGRPRRRTRPLRQRRASLRRRRLLRRRLHGPPPNPRRSARRAGRDPSGGSSPPRDAASPGSRGGPALRHGARMAG